MIIVQACSYDIFVVCCNCWHTLLCSFIFLYFLPIFVPPKNSGFCAHLSSNYFILFSFIEAYDIIPMCIKECLFFWILLDMHNNSKSCRMVCYLILWQIFQIISAIFGSIAKCVIQLNGNWRSFSSTLVIVFVGWFFNCSFPRFYSHKLVALLFIHLKIIRLFFWFLLLNLLFKVWYSNILKIFNSFMVLNLSLTLFFLFLIFFLNNWSLLFGFII